MFTFGFYNSLNGDRKYNAEQISSIFDGIIEDGVFSNVGEKFATIPGTGMQVIVKTGRAWFKHTWNLNDSWMTLNIDESDPIRSRIDSVILEVNSNQEFRSNTIKILKGTVATYPVAPTMQHADGVDQYRLADVTIGPGVSGITSANIAIKVGQGDTPFVTAPLKAADISDLFKQWNAQWDNELSSWQSEFDDWFQNLKQQLTDDVVTNLQKQIDERVKTADKATSSNITNGTSNKWVDAAGLKAKLDSTADITYGLKIGDIVYSSRDLEKETGGKMIACDQRELLVNQYPELCAVDEIKGRLRNFKLRSNQNMAVSDTKVSYLNGSLYKGDMYHVVFDTNIEVRCYRSYLENTSTTYETIVTIASPGSVNRAVYFKDDKCYIFGLGHGNASAYTSNYNKWFIVDLINKRYDTIEDSTLYPSLDATYYSFSPIGCHIIDNSNICIYGGGSISFTRNSALRIYAMKYNITSKTRKFIYYEAIKNTTTTASGGWTACTFGYDMKGVNIHNNTIYFAGIESASTTSSSPNFSNFKLALISVNLNNDTTSTQYIQATPLSKLNAISSDYMVNYNTVFGVICTDNYIFIYKTPFGNTSAAFGTFWTQFYVLLNYSGAIVKSVEQSINIMYGPYYNRNGIPVLTCQLSEKRDFIISHFDINGSEQLGKLSLNANLSLESLDISSELHYMTASNPSLATYQSGSSTYIPRPITFIDDAKQRLSNIIDPMFVATLNTKVLILPNNYYTYYTNLYDYEAGRDNKFESSGQVNGSTTLITFENNTYVSGALSVLPYTLNTQNIPYFILVHNNYLIFAQSATPYIIDLNYRIAPYLPNAYIKAKN